jgi:hypothetical protein
MLSYATTLAPLAGGSRLSLHNKKTLHFVAQFFLLLRSDNLFFNQRALNKRVCQQCGLGSPPTLLTKEP